MTIPPQAQQAGAIITARVNPFAKCPEYRHGDQRSQFCKNIPLEFFLHESGNHLGNTFTGLEGREDVPQRIAAQLHSYQEHRQTL